MGRVRKWLRDCGRGFNHLQLLSDLEPENIYSESQGGLCWRCNTLCRAGLSVNQSGSSHGASLVTDWSVGQNSNNAVFFCQIQFPLQIFFLGRQQMFRFRSERRNKSRTQKSSVTHFHLFPPRHFTPMLIQHIKPCSNLFHLSLFSIALWYCRGVVVFCFFPIGG